MFYIKTNSRKTLAIKKIIKLNSRKRKKEKFSLINGDRKTGTHPHLPSQKNACFVTGKIATSNLVGTSKQFFKYLALSGEISGVKRSS